MNSNMYKKFFSKKENKKNRKWSQHIPTPVENWSSEYDGDGGDDGGSSVVVVVVLAQVGWINDREDRSFSPWWDRTRRYPLGSKHGGYVNCEIWLSHKWRFLFFLSHSFPFSRVTGPPQSAIPHDMLANIETFAT